MAGSARGRGYVDLLVPLRIASVAGRDSGRLGLGERDALGVKLSQVAAADYLAADGVVLGFVAGGALLAHLLPVREGGLVGGDGCGDGGVLGRTSLVEGEVGVVCGRRGCASF